MTIPDQYDAYYTNRNALSVIGAAAPIPPYMKGLLPAEKDARILDIGCGLGDMLAALRKEGYTDVSGVDISGEAVAHCKSMGLDVAKVREVADISVGEGVRRFDMIIMSHVLEHIRKDSIIDTLRYVKDGLLAPGGGIFIRVPNAQSNTGCYWAYEDFTHHTLFTAGSLEFVLKTAGFTEVRFVDPDGTYGLGILRKAAKRALLRLYVMNMDFWNRVTSSSYHRPSPRIYSYDIKALAR